MNILKKLEACREGQDYANQHKTLEDAWNNCHRGDWMLWLARKLNVPIKTRILTEGLCANTVRHLMKDKRSTDAVDAAIAFGRGRIKCKELYAAAATAAAAAAAANVAYAAYAAYAANANANAAAYAAYAAADAAYAANADCGSARKANWQQTADICRKVLTRSVFARLRKMEKTNGI